jgi:hypothetical protein
MIKPPYHRNFKCTQMPLEKCNETASRLFKKLDDACTGIVTITKGEITKVYECTLTDTPEPISLTNKTNINGE